MLSDIQIVFTFLAWLIDLTEHLYTDTALFLVALYILAVSALVRLVYWLMGANRSND